MQGTRFAEFRKGALADWCLVYLLDFKRSLVARILAQELACRDKGYPNGCLQEVEKLKRFLGWPAPPEPPAPGKPPTKPEWLKWIEDYGGLIVPGSQFVSAAEEALQRQNVSSFILLKYRRALEDLCGPDDCCYDKDCAAWLMLYKIQNKQVDWNAEKYFGAPP